MSSTIGRLFLDTNVLVYLFDDSEPDKRAIAAARLEEERKRRELVVSTQVLQELYCALTKGKDPILLAEKAELAVREVSKLVVAQVDPLLIFEAIGASRRHQISFWDALILETARGAGCPEVLSEDLNHAQDFDGIVVENPFVKTRAGGGK